MAEEVARQPALRREPKSFITYTQNHDQIANTFDGRRLHELTSPGKLRAVTALHLLAPRRRCSSWARSTTRRPRSASSRITNRSSPRKSGKAGRSSCSSSRTTPCRRAQASLPDPADPQTFARSKLDPEDRIRHRATLDLYRDLLRIRKSDPLFARQAREDIEGAVLSDRALVLRWIDAAIGDRLLLINLGEQLDLRPAPEPLLAPPAAAKWQMLWSSDEPRYGGPGALCPCEGEGWRIPAESAYLLKA